MKNFSVKTLKEKLEAIEKELQSCKESGSKSRRHIAAFARGIERLIKATSPEYAKQFFPEHYKIINKGK